MNSSSMEKYSYLLPSKYNGKKTLILEELCLSDVVQFNSPNLSQTAKPAETSQSYRIFRSKKYHKEVLL